MACFDYNTDVIVCELNKQYDRLNSVIVSEQGGKVLCSYLDG